MECAVSVRNFIILMKYCPGILIWGRSNIAETLGLLFYESFSLLLLFALCHIRCPFMYNFLYISSYMNKIFMFGMLMNVL